MARGPGDWGAIISQVITKMPRAITAIIFVDIDVTLGYIFSILVLEKC